MEVVHQQPKPVARRQAGARAREDTDGVCGRGLGLAGSSQESG